MTMSITTIAESKSTQIFQIPAFKDNYIYIIHNIETKTSLAVDPGDPDVVIAFLKSQNWNLDGILVTHHHWDHVDGIPALTNKFQCPVYALAKDSHRIPAVTHTLAAPQELIISNMKFEVEFIPGHTLGHIYYFMPNEKYLFSGDTVFSLGCGRLFEGSPAQMLSSLQKIRTLPDDTLIFSTHEYTLTNCKFALTLEPQNLKLKEKLEQVQQLRDDHKPTVPTTLLHEKTLNPFLRWDDPELRSALKMESATNLEVFTHIRSLRNNY